MAISRYYSSTAGKMVLIGGITNSATSMVVDSTVGLPGSTPFTLIIDPGSNKEEIVTVNAVGGTTLTIVRGEDGSSPQSHDSGAEVRHGITARDLADSRAHENQTAGAHGTSGNVVGTDSAQTLKNKAMSGVDNTFTNIPKSAIPADVLYAATVQTVTNKAIDGLNNNLTNIQKSSLPGATAYTDVNNVFAKGQTVKAEASSVVPMVAQGAPGQTADLQKWQNSSGTDLARIDSTGKVIAPGVQSSGPVSGTTGTFSSTVSAPNLTHFLNPPYCEMQISATTVPINSDTQLNLDTIIENNFGMADVANKRINITTSGLYLVTGGVSFTSTFNDGMRRFLLFKNTILMAGDTAYENTTGYGHYVNASFMARFNAGDYIRAIATQATGANITAGGNTAGRVTVRWIAP